MSTQLVTAQDEGKLIQKVFAANLEAMKKSAPRTMGDSGRLIRIAYNTIVYDDKLRKCTHQSLVGGVMEALKLGITLGGPMQEGWLIPFNDTKANALVATLIVGYMGYRNIIDRARSTLDLHPYSVWKGDHFKFRLGDRPAIDHVPGWHLDPPVTRKEFRGRGLPPDLVATYAVAHLRGGGMQLEVLNTDQIESHRMRSRAKDSGPWVTDYEQMGLKTVIRVIAKRLPKSSELLARALDLDDKADRGVPQDFDLEGIVVFDEPVGEKKKPSTLDALKQQMAGNAPPPAELKLDDDPSLTAENNALDAEIAAEEARNKEKGQ